jgi:putative transposase
MADKRQIPNDLVDELLKDYKEPGDLLGPDGLLKQLTGALVERALNGEMTAHLGYEKHSPTGRGTGNSRNGTSKKTLKTEQGDVPVRVPRDRNGSFEPALVKKHQTHFDGFDEKIISMYARGMSVREIQGHLSDLYGTEVSRDLISKATDGVLEEVKAWQTRPLDPVYPIVYMDALVLKVRHQGTVTNRSAYIAIGVNMDGRKEVLGIWLETTEGAKFWHKVMTELKNRGVQDILIACVDGLKGFPDAIEAVWPKTIVQTCIVHMIRNSVRYVTWGDRREVVADLKLIYGAATEGEAEQALDEFEAKWRERFPMIAQSWRANWERVTPFLGFPAEIRKVIYTTNAIEALNRQLRKVIKTRGHFPTDDSAIKLLYLALLNAEKKWSMPIRAWKRALNQLAIHFEGRLPV